MAKYRIWFEAIDGDFRLNEKFGDGIECDGFVFLGNLGKSGVAVIHDVTTMETAQLITGHETMLTASKLAMLMEKLLDMKKGNSDREFLERVLGSLNVD